MNPKKNQYKKGLSYHRGERIPVEIDLISAFLNHVRSAPNLTAIMTSDTTWTYQELLDDVLIWKYRLHAINARGPVLICLHRTPRLVSILLALQWLEIASFLSNLTHLSIEFVLFWMIVAQQLYYMIPRNMKLTQHYHVRYGRLIC